MSNDKQNNAPAESQPLNMGGVSGSSSSCVSYVNNLFVDAIKEIDQNAHQPWIDKRLWLINGENDYPLKVVIYDNEATVGPNVYGGCQPLRANTPEELKECCKMWWRNRWITANGQLVCKSCPFAGCRPVDKLKR